MWLAPQLLWGVSCVQGSCSGWPRPDASRRSCRIVKISRRIAHQQFTIEFVPDRIENLGDLWAGVLAAKHDLGRLLGAES